MNLNTSYKHYKLQLLQLRECTTKKEIHFKIDGNMSKKMGQSWQKAGRVSGTNKKNVLQLIRLIGNSSVTWLEIKGASEGVRVSQMKTGRGSVCEKLHLQIVKHF